MRSELKPPLLKHIYWWRPAEAFITATQKEVMKRLLHAAAGLARSIGLPSLPRLVKSLYDPHSNRYHRPRGPEKYLGPSFFAPIERPGGTAADKPNNDLYTSWATVSGGHKWFHYFDVYDNLLGPFRGRPIRMLEIGVYQGASLKTWRHYLHPDSVIVGLDIDPRCAQYDAPGQHMHVRIGDQSDARFLADVVREFGPFDVILDDGSHICSHMVASLNHLFLSGLDDEGIYIAEDTHTNFWSDYRDQRYSFVDLCKDLVDVMHSHYEILTSEPGYRLGHAAHTQMLSVPRISAQIKEITFRDSIIAIRKKKVAALPTSVHL